MENKPKYYDINWKDLSREWLEFSDNYFRVQGEPFENIKLIEERYYLENSCLLAVMNGNEKEAIDSLTKLHSSYIPYRLHDKIRDHKDLCITYNTLLRKAAENCGVHPIHIDALSNRIIKQIEEVTDLEQFFDLSHKIAHSYCQLIKEFNMQNYSLPIRRAVTYIRTDLTENLSLSSLAEMLNVNPSYLSTLFKKEIGIPVTEYVNRCRITQAQHLLRATDLPIKDVAHRCGISDLNYFTRMFKRITGTTPKAFRTQAFPAAEDASSPLTITTSESFEDSTAD